MLWGGDTSQLVPGRNTMQPLGVLSERPCLNESDHTSRETVGHWAQDSDLNPTHVM
jgi:hypothetical protein